MSANKAKEKIKTREESAKGAISRQAVARRGDCLKQKVKGDIFQTAGKGNRKPPKRIEGLQFDPKRLGKEKIFGRWGGGGAPIH